MPDHRAARVDDIEFKVHAILLKAYAAGGRKARPYEVWVETRAVEIHWRFRGGVFPAPMEA